MVHQKSIPVTPTYSMHVPILCHRLCFKTPFATTDWVQSKETIQKTIRFPSFWYLTVSAMHLFFLCLLWNHSHSGTSPYLSVLPCWSNPFLAPEQDQPTSFQWVMRNFRNTYPPTSGIKLWISNLMSSFQPAHSFCQKERLL